MEDGIGGNGCIPFRFPCDGKSSSSSSSWLSMDVTGRDFGIAVVGRVVVDWLNAIDVCGRLPYADRGRLLGPTLFEKLPFDVFRDDTEGVRDDMEDEKELFRVVPAVPYFCINVSDCSRTLELS
jgi:hypothetical protein